MRRLSIPRIVPILLCSMAVSSCERPAEPDLSAPAPNLDVDEVEGRNPFLGSWKMTSAVVGDDELLAGTDLQWIATYRSDGTHSVSVSNDSEQNVCKVPPQTACEWDGTYRYTGTTITHDEPDHPDPDEAGEDTALYAACGGKWFLLDSGGDDIGVRLTFQRTGQGR